MNLAVPVAYPIILFILMFTRLAAIIWVLPLFSLPSIPMRWRAAFIFFLCVVITPILPPAWRAATPAIDFLSLAMMVGAELMLGLTVGLIIRLILEIIALGGYLMDRDLGFAMTSLFAPGTMGGQTINSLLFMQGFYLLFLITDTHLILIRIVVDSFRTLGPGQFVTTNALLDEFLELSSTMFVLAFQFALPIFALVLMINVSMGLITRFAQEFQVMMLSFPLRLGLGLFILMGATPVLLTFSRDLLAMIERHLLLLWGA